jgi:putative membrane protein
MRLNLDWRQLPIRLRHARLHGWRWIILGGVCVAATPATTSAHDGQPLMPHDLAGAWNWDPLILAGLVVGGLLYRRGTHALWRRAGPGKGVAHWQALSFVGSLMSLFVALISPLDALAATLFSAHMVQHMLLILVAAPLLVLGSPLLPLLWSLPLAYRRGSGRWWRGQRVLRSSWRLLTLPLIAWIAHAVALWIWHVPGLYDLALRSHLVHALEHAMFLGTALLWWWIIIQPALHRSGLVFGTGILSIFTMAVQSSLLGALITFSHVPWYRGHADNTEAWRLTPMEDQQLAGLIMWIPGGVAYLLAGGILFVVWLRAVEHSMLRREQSLEG